MVKHLGKQMDSHFERERQMEIRTGKPRDLLMDLHFVMGWHWGFLRGRH
jgi:hypothetical protein